MSKPSSTCPRCGASSPLDSCDEVDVGIGIISGNHSWECPNCGRWAPATSEPTSRVHTFYFADLELTLCRGYGRQWPGENEALERLGKNLGELHRITGA